MNEEEFQKRATDKWAGAKQDLHESGGWRKWKALPPSTKRYIVIGVVIVLILIVVAATWGTPGIYPSGEGG